MEGTWNAVALSMTDQPEGFLKGTEMPTAGGGRQLWLDPKGYLAAVGLRSGIDVIDLCSGDCWFTVQIAKVAGRVTAIDIDTKFVGSRTAPANGKWSNKLRFHCR